MGKVIGIDLGTTNSVLPFSKVANPCCKVANQ